MKKTMTKIKFENRSESLKPKKRIMPFITAFSPAAPNIKSIFMKIWHIIQSQQQINSIFSRPPVMSYKIAQPLKDMLILERNFKTSKQDVKRNWIENSL